ncbi:ProQ activator of osmoprotectant transporter ProP [Pasteurella dagmatis ATCC 43325]|uniref:RNA chaperone ProQ n=2 Tax=Pasteurella dagmatis TaxID=754 RepID=C9PRB3_9PAST|nr:ProQ activator of osmoprotectant transporter ProP [Pasteurella dagmatis ATCC 43325]
MKIDIQELAMTEVQKLTNNKEIIAYLVEKFPLCFSLEGEAKPLKIGLFQDLAEALQNDEQISKTQLRQALRAYTSNWRYLHSCKEGVERVDLQGNPCGVLEKEHAQHAAKQLAEAKAKLSEKLAAEKVANLKKKRPAFKSNNKVVNNKEKSVVKLKRPSRPKIELNAVDVEKLQKGDKIKVKVGDSAKNAIFLENLKENVRIELENGLVINVTADRLFV